jgi:hypothetical protein
MHARPACLPHPRHGASSLIPRALLCAALLLACGFAAAHVPTIHECTEGSDFIRNAALARDKGMSETGFMQKLREDIELIQSFPPVLRWFVQDADDARFLMSAAGDVFRQPRAADEHRGDFFKACIIKASGKKTIGL